MEDMTRLNYLHEPALLNNIRHRFERDHVYTYTGKICIAVNPFNWQARARNDVTRVSQLVAVRGTGSQRAAARLPQFSRARAQVSQPLYTEERLVTYRGRELADLPPHIYAIAEEAYQAIVDGPHACNQSILVSGESGAGKTESVKIMMQYLAVVSKSGDQNKVAAQVRGPRGCTCVRDGQGVHRSRGPILTTRVRFSRCTAGTRSRLPAPLRPNIRHPLLWLFRAGLTSMLGPVASFAPREGACIQPAPRGFW